MAEHIATKRTYIVVWASLMCLTAATAGLPIWNWALSIQSGPVHRYLQSHAGRLDFHGREVHQSEDDLGCHCRRSFLALYSNFPEHGRLHESLVEVIVKHNHSQHPRAMRSKPESRLLWRYMHAIFGQTYCSLRLRYWLWNERRILTKLHRMRAVASRASLLHGSRTGPGLPLRVAADRCGRPGASVSAFVVCRRRELHPCVDR